MEWIDYLPFLLPLVAVVAIVWGLFFEKRRRGRSATAARSMSPPAADARKSASPPAHTPPGADVETALVHLEAAGVEGPTSGPSRLNTWLRAVTERGDSAQLGRLARIDPAVLEPLGNTPAHLYSAMGRSEGDVRRALAGQRNAVLAIAADRQLSLWREMLSEVPVSIDPDDGRLEALVTGELPGVLPRMLADLAEREHDPAWRAFRLHLIGYLNGDHPDHPPGSDTLRWLMDGLHAAEPDELSAAIEAFPGIASDHRFDPDASEAAVLRDRAIELATSDHALDENMAGPLGEGLSELTSLVHVDRKPVDEVAARLLNVAAPDGGDPTELWSNAARLLRRGEALLQLQSFVRLAVERNPQHAIVAAAALLGLEKIARRSRSLKRPDFGAELVSHDLLRHAPAPVVVRLVEALETGLTWEWEKREVNLPAIRAACSRTDLPDDLSDRLALLEATMSRLCLQRWREENDAVFERFKSIAAGDWTPRHVAACVEKVEARFPTDRDGSRAEMTGLLDAQADRPFWRAVRLRWSVTTSGEPDAASADSVVRYLVTGMLDTDTKVRDAAEISWQILRERCAAGTVDRDGVGAALAACVDSRPVADRLRGELESG